MTARARNRASGPKSTSQPSSTVGPQGEIVGVSRITCRPPPRSTRAVGGGDTSQLPASRQCTRRALARISVRAAENPGCRGGRLLGTSASRRGSGVHERKGARRALGYGRSAGEVAWQRGAVRNTGVRAAVIATKAVSGASVSGGRGRARVTSAGGSTAPRAGRGEEVSRGSGAKARRTRKVATAGWGMLPGTSSPVARRCRGQNQDRGSAPKALREGPGWRSTASTAPAARVGWAGGDAFQFR